MKSEVWRDVPRRSASRVMTLITKGGRVEPEQGGTGVMGQRWFKGGTTIAVPPEKKDLKLLPSFIRRRGTKGKIPS